MIRRSKNSSGFSHQVAKCQMTKRLVVFVVARAYVERVVVRVTENLQTHILHKAIQIQNRAMSDVPYAMAVETV